MGCFRAENIAHSVDLGKQSPVRPLAPKVIGAHKLVNIRLQVEYSLGQWRLLSAMLIRCTVGLERIETPSVFAHFKFYVIDLI